MTRSLYRPGMIVILAIVLAACSDQTVPTTALETTAPHLDAVQAGPPPSSGPYVIRYEGVATFLIVDPVTGAGAFFGGDLTALCAGDDNGYDPVSIKDIDVPADANRINEMIKGRDVRASLWDPAPASCDDVTASTPVATGYGRMVSTDNDLLVFLNPDNRNVNAFGVSAHGALTTPEGETIRVSAHSRCVWDGSDSSTLTCRDKVTAN